MSDNIYLVPSKQMQWPKFVSVYKCTYDGGPRMGFTFYTVLEGRAPALLLPTAAARGSSNGWRRGKLLGWLRCANHGLSAGQLREEETRPAACVVCTTDAVAQVRETSALIRVYFAHQAATSYAFFFFFLSMLVMLGTDLSAQFCLSI